jgi:DNA-binding transcriptional MerR regulator
MTKAKRYTVSQVASMAHVTVRTLHHYDEIGLLVPSERTAKGYRLYDEADLRRLQQILIFRELDFSLEAIGQILDAPVFERGTALRAQRDVLVRGLRRTEAVLKAVDAALAAMEGEGTMDTKRMFEGFEEFDHAKHQAEAEQRWGHTDAYKESMRRAKQYSREDWVAIKAEGEAATNQLAALLAEGKAPDGQEAMDAAEVHRMHITRWFYPCSHAMHVGLARMYQADARFTETYEKRAKGLAAFVARAIEANARRAGVTETAAGGEC